MAYLNPEMSNFALQLLKDAKYNDGIRAGIPPNIQLAQKFGVYDIVDGNTQLHNCAVVYHPLTPYTLCVMTRGKNERELARTIASISKSVYNEVTEHERNNAR